MAGVYRSFRGPRGVKIYGVRVGRLVWDPGVLFGPCTAVTFSIDEMDLARSVKGRLPEGLAARVVRSPKS